MPQSLADVNLHIVFSTLNRRNFLIDPGLKARAHAYLGGIAKKKECPTIIVGGVADHVHILLEFGRTITIADLVKEVKRSSTIWLSGEGLPDFSWQAGYGVFAVGQSQIESVKDYISRQEEHHRLKTFQEEYRELLVLHKKKWDERYVWD